MGRKTGTETALGLIVAFVRRNVWAQADLARELDIGVAALRKKLAELQSAGVPLEKEEDHPHVYWSVPKKWLPDAVQLDSVEVGELLRLLARLPLSASRNRIVERVLQGRARPVERANAVVAPAFAQQEEQWLSFVEDAASRGEVLIFRYYSASRGHMESREASPHKVLVGPPARFMATCHRSGTLKWFRVDRISSARLAGKACARTADAAALAEALRTSVNGFHDGEGATEVEFFVRDPHSRWVSSDLPAPLVFEPVTGGIVVRGRTAAIVMVAKFVVTLGAAARADTPALRAIVRDLAEGTLEANQETERAASRRNRSEAGVTKERWR
ncbi:hypothetical protein BH09MYX1_BH09MYX1_46330 [soil metagenome]